MELTKADIHNLIVFLNRVQLTGNEAQTFVLIVEKLKAQMSDVGGGESINE